MLSHVKTAARAIGFSLVICIMLSLCVVPAFADTEGEATPQALSGSAVDVATEPAIAVNILKSDMLSVADKDGHTYNKLQLLDGRYTTKLQLDNVTEISIEADEYIYGLYVIWDREPGLWALEVSETAGNRMYVQGRSGFIHEYVKLEKPSRSVTLITPNTGTIICELSAYGAGELPDSVQVWNEPYEDADMLLLSTHADDEHLFFGGTMPYYAGELGKNVQIAYLTNHWAEPYRPHELLNGLWTVGMTSYPIISQFTDYYSDSLEHAKTLYDLDEVKAYEVELLRRFKPEVVIGHDINGEYGHGVHMLNTWVLQQAIELANDETAYPDSAAMYGTFAVSKVYLHNYADKNVSMNWNIPLEHFGGRTAFQMAEAGFAEHVSQQKWFHVRNDGVYDCRSFGLYYTAVGDDGGLENPDFFQNIDTYSDDPLPFEDVTPSAIGEGDEQLPDEGKPVEEESGLLYSILKSPKLLFATGITIVVLIVYFIISVKVRKRGRGK